MRNPNKRLVRRVIQVLVSSLITLAIVGALFFVTWGRDIPVLNPSGTIADQEFILIAITTGLGIFVVVPVFVLLFSIAWKYRASNEKAIYEPELEGNRKLEALWWGIPCLIILVLAVITWVSTHALDPYKTLKSDITPVKVQVVSLNWKWLFIYPEYGIATVNYMNIPKDTPINLELTSDAPMNSFWVPALAGQVYSMSGMSTKLHFMADSTGTFNGSSTNISGDGYADMNFKVYSLNEPDFVNWTRKAAKSSNMLTAASYEKLAKDSVKNPETTYMLMASTLYDDIVMKYMHEDGAHDHDHAQEKAHDDSHEGMSH